MLLFEVLVFFVALHVMDRALSVNLHQAFVDQVLDLAFEVKVLSISLLHELVISQLLIDLKLNRNKYFTFIMYVFNPK